MKKILKTLISSCVCFAVTAIVASATPTMDMEWKGDYSDNDNPKLVVSFTSPARYKQTVTSVIRDVDTNNFLYLSETVVNGGKENVITYDILDGFNRADFRYKLKLQGNGHMSDSCHEEQYVYMINKQAIPGILNDFNNATVDTMGACIANVRMPLQLVNSAAPTNIYLETMLNIKNIDFGSSYENLEQIRNSWNAAEMIVYFNNGGCDVGEVEAKIIEFADIIGLNLNDGDYVKYDDIVYSSLATSASQYNNGAGLRSMKDLKNAIYNYIGVAVINASDTKNIASNFDRYKNYFNISAEYLAKFNAITDEGVKGSVVSAIMGKNYTDSAQLVNDFKAKLDMFGPSSTPVPTLPPVNVNPNGSTMGGSISGGTSGGSSDTETVTPPAAEITFKDLDSNHWAQSYIRRLSENNVIGGYDDGTFRPANNITREEFVKIIISATKLYNKDAECEFTDVPKDAWYYKYVASANATGVVTGIDDKTFGISSNITRQDASVICARLLKLFNSEISELGTSELTDTDAIDDYAKDSVYLLESMKIITGYDDGSFKPQHTITRAEASAIICRLVDSL